MKVPQNISIPETSSAYDYPLLITKILSSIESHKSKNRIVSTGGSSFSYEDFIDRVKKVSNLLIDLGIEPGDVVGIMHWDDHRYLELFFAIPMIGAVLHTINVRLPEDNILYTINHAEDKLIIVHDDFLDLFQKISSSAVTVRGVLQISESDNPKKDFLSSQIDFHGDYELRIKDMSSYYNPIEFHENTRATTFYTTGTTGTPKGVYFSHRQICLHTLSVLSALSSQANQGSMHKTDTYMPLTPMFHVHAWGIPYVASLMGVKQVYPGRFEPAKILSLIKKESITFSHCVPTILQLLMDSPAIDTVDLSNWKVIIGGSALSPSLANRAHDLGIDIFGGYGLSESCPVLTLSQIDEQSTTLTPKDTVDLRCKAGRPIPLVDIRIVDEDFNFLPPDGISEGEIVVRAPWLTQGYLNNSEDSENLWMNGYLHTGDVGYVDINGYLNVTDRLKDIIKSGGEWVSSIAIERFVLESPEVTEVAAIGVLDKKWGERPILFVKSDSDVICKFLMKRFDLAVKQGLMKSWAVPDKIIRVTSIPKTSVGKIDKKTLRSKYGYQ